MTECPCRYVKAAWTEFHIIQMVLKLFYFLDSEHQTRPQVALMDVQEAGKRV